MKRMNKNRPGEKHTVSHKLTKHYRAISFSFSTTGAGIVLPGEACTGICWLIDLIDLFIDWKHWNEFNGFNLKMGYSDLIRSLNRNLV